MNLRSKPILVAGVSLSILLWIWESFQKSFVAIGEYGFLVVLIVSGSLWLFAARRQTISPKLVLPKDKDAVLKEIQQVRGIIKIIETEAQQRDIINLKQQVDQLPVALDRIDLNIAIAGTKHTGKTTLATCLAARSIADHIQYIDTVACLQEREDDRQFFTEINNRADLVLFLCGGDLTDSEQQIITTLQNFDQPLLLIFNKQDLYPSEERDFLYQTLQQRVKGIIASEDVILAATAPNPVKVIQQQIDGSKTEYLEFQKPELSSLTSRLTHILATEKERLIWMTTWRQTIALKQQAKDLLNEIRREHCLPIIEQYQWIAAVTAFANPVAAFDLLATAAINAQMLVDIGSIYQQKLSLDQARMATESIGKLIVKLGLIEISSQAIVGILKTNAITYVAGGTIQGVGAAYLTYLVGLSSIAYFQELEISSQNNESLNIDRLGQKLQQIFEQTKRSEFLQNLVKQSLIKLRPEAQKTTTA
jgi:uncharacterized protein